MAFAGKLGTFVRQNISRNTALNGQGSLTSMYNAVRCMSGSKLFIGSLSYDTDEQSLKEAFTSYGDITEAKIIVDRENGRSRGFGFVSYTSEENAAAAQTAMDGQDLAGRAIRVSYANERPSGGSRGGGGYGGGGGGY
ncbi:hypothetical protein MKW94_025237 [Papaver nudicaule]|uniref:RRM domain-containing protein n=1 Tax=Papaver nudicaule TaxID=74823 RepID=A0AA41RVM2_PAPNU|nr:hypothetical protein [Papaver nudicaule]MCL7047918.1 hypothetical protein [Papaver nudicaule]